MTVFKTVYIVDFIINDFKWNIIKIYWLIILSLDSWATCDSLLVISVTLTCTSRYLTVAVTCVRLISVTEPLRFESRVTPQRAVISIIMLCTANAIICLAFLARPASCKYHQAIFTLEVLSIHTHQASVTHTSSIIVIQKQRAVVT